jgi:hypothetical protein
VSDDLRAHRCLRRELAVAVAADEEDVRLERLALLAVEPVHEYRLALVDDVLLPAESDDRVVHLSHDGRNAGTRPRGGEF